MYIADLHIHSKYSRATSPNMNLEYCARWAKLKGINMLGTGDITHPAWRAGLKKALTPCGRERVFKYGGIDFVLTGEVSSIYHKKGALRKIHNVLFFSSFESAETFCLRLGKHADLASDGRPTLMLDAKTVVKMVRDADPKGFVVPAHIWTPHFSLFGANSGFDRIEDCFEEETAFIPALETGLSSDPPMNWRLSALDKFSLISNSDAHSPQKLAREANVFAGPMSFGELLDILKTRDTRRFLFTVEYFPEEGKYHLDGHRFCKVCTTPEETIKNKFLCPACGKRVTVGVMHRVIRLADRDADAKGKVPFRHVVPLDQVIAAVLGKELTTRAVQEAYTQTLQALGPEMKLLLETPDETILKTLPEPIARGIVKMRKGKVTVIPGYDGEFGTVTIGPEHDEVEDEQSQQTLF